MAFCSKCGAQLADGAQFCNGCGAPVASAQNDGSKRVQKFVGEIRKCPNCGQELQSFQGKCPACGIELAGVSAARSVTTFFEKYQKETDLHRQMDIVKNFPIPNAKEDLLEFALLAEQQIRALTKIAVSNIKSLASSFASVQEWANAQASRMTLSGKAQEASKQASDAVATEEQLAVWVEKLELVVQKVKLSFTGDSATIAQVSEILKSAQAETEKLDAARLAKKKKKTTMIVGIILGFVLFMAVCIVPTVLLVTSDGKKVETETTRLEALYSSIQSDITAGNYDAAELGIAELRWNVGSGKTANAEAWDTKRETLQKQLDRKRNGGN